MINNGFLSVNQMAVIHYEGGGGVNQCGALIKCSE